jgi:putative component of membrane protein insertase Oxa1/YidC/SpoIIIJ protein YidD
VYQYTIIRIILVALFAFLALATLCPAAEDKIAPPWDFKMSGKGSSVESGQNQISAAGRLLKGAVSFYSTYISAVDGDRCSMYPTCSAYSIQAIQKHGFFLGYIMTTDRLIHEADESGIAPLVQVGGRVRNFDPVSNNDFWWYKEKKNTVDN